jgi:hypothetical protein
MKRLSGKKLALARTVDVLLAPLAAARLVARRLRRPGAARVERILVARGGEVVEDLPRAEHQAPHLAAPS